MEWQTLSIYGIKFVSQVLCNGVAILKTRISKIRVDAMGSTTAPIERSILHIEQWCKVLEDSESAHILNPLMFSFDKWDMEYRRSVYEGIILIRDCLRDDPTKYQERSLLALLAEELYSPSFENRSFNYLELIEFYQKLSDFIMQVSATCESNGHPELFDELCNILDIVKKKLNLPIVIIKEYHHALPKI